MKKLLAIVLAAIIVFFGISLYFERFAPPEGDDFLRYVGENRPLPKSYEPELIELSNGERVSAQMYPFLQEMFDDMRARGVYPRVRSGYRSYEEQKIVLENKITALMAEGYSKSEAKREAYNWVAKPGESEHQLGLSVDINAVKGKSSQNQVYNWLMDNAHRYGFICRYPGDKVDITGISNEPWHYRYVGVGPATEMYERCICLEEYLGID